MNCGVAFTPSLRVSSSTILPMENHNADLSLCHDQLLHGEVCKGLLRVEVLPLGEPRHLCWPWKRIDLLLLLGMSDLTSFLGFRVRDASV